MYFGSNLTNTVNITRFSIAFDSLVIWTYGISKQGNIVAYDMVIQ